MFLPQRTARSLGLMLAAIVAVTGLSLWTLRRREAAHTREMHALNVLLALDDVAALVRDAEANQRAYLLTDAPRFRSRYEAAARELKPRLTHLEQLTAPDATQHAQVLELSHLARRELDQLARELSRREVGGDDRLEKRVHAQVLELQRRQQAALTNHLQTDSTATARSVGAVLVGSALLLAFALIASLFVRSDFLARTAAEAEASRQQRRYRSLIEASGDVVWTTTASGLMRADTAGWGDLTGQSAATASGKGWLEAVHPEDLPRTQKAWARGLQRRAPFSLEHRVLTRDHEYRHFSVRAVPVVGSGRAVEEWVGVHTDITERHKAEAERERLIGRLVETNAELDRFAHVTSHDLKAPLRGITTLSRWLEEQLGAEVAAPVRDNLRLLRERSQRLVGLVDGILAYSRAGHRKSRLEQVDAERLVKDTIELLAPPATARVEPKGPLPTLRTERAPFQQVWMNLVGNALKYSGRQDAVVELSARDAGRFWDFQVTDNGPGIAPEHQSSIWGLFATVGPRSAGGTGIGLSVVKKIVEGKGGRAWVESTPGRGSTFHFTWPKQEA